MSLLLMATVIIAISSCKCASDVGAPSPQETARPEAADVASAESPSVETAPAAAASAEPEPPVAAVEPQPYYGKIAMRLVNTLPKAHVLQQRLDSSIVSKLTADIF